MSRFNGYLVSLVLAAGALALPLSAEEIIVTVPPDPPARTDAAPEEQPSTLPAYTNNETASGRVAQDTAAPVEDTKPEAGSSPAAQPEPAQPEPAPRSDSAASSSTAPATAKKPPTKVKKEKATAPAETGSTGGAAHATGEPAKPKAKKASAGAACKGLDETACGGNAACIWVVGTPAEGASKATKAGCRSLAAMNKEAEKARKAWKSDGDEVLPWASHTSTVISGQGGAAEKTKAAARTTPASGAD